jgi:hypothetical protein
MNKNKNNNKREKDSSEMVQLLRQIAASEITQSRGTPPPVPDIKPMSTTLGKVYTFQKKFSPGTMITPSTTLDVFGAVQFDLNSTTDASSFQALFDAWRIKQVTVDFVPLTTGPYQSPLYTVIDYDDASTPTTIASLLEYDTCAMIQGGTLQKRTFAPRVALAAYNSTLFTNYAEASANQWNDVASPSTKYYGLKYGVPSLTGGTATPTYTLVYTIVYQFKSGR